MSSNNLGLGQDEASVPTHGKKYARRGTKLFASAMLVSQASALLRFVILARLIGPEQVGLAALIILVGQFYDMSTDAGLDRFLVQDKQGNNPDTLSCIHFITLCRALFIAIMMVVLAIPIADLFNAPQLASPFMFFAAVPLCQGFLNYDFRRQQREHNFGSEGKVLIASETLALVVTTIAAVITRDFTAVIFGLIARALAMTMMSHWTSERKYEIRLERQYIRPVFAFGWPLIANGLVLYAANQGDRLWIGKLLGPTELGHYSAIILLIYYPSFTLLRQVTTIAMPWIAEVRDNVAEANRRISLLSGQTMMLTCLMIAGFVMVTPIVVPILFGEEFAQPAFLIAVIGILQSIRFIRVWPTTIAIAAGRSGQVLVNNIIRLIGFPAAYVTFLYWPSLEGIVLGFVAGEVVSFVVAIYLSNRIYSRTLMHDGLNIFLMLSISASVASGAYGASIGSWSLSIAMSCLSALLIVWILAKERESLKSFWELVVQNYSKLIKQ